MANAIYAKAKEKFLSGTLDLTSVTVKAILIDTADYTYSAAHDFLDDVPGAARVATSGALGSKTVTNGIFDAADVVFVAPSGDSVEAIIVYHDSGVESTSTLLAYIDVAASGLPITPNGTNLLLAWDNGGNGIFKL